MSTQEEERREKVDWEARRRCRNSDHGSRRCLGYSFCLGRMVQIAELRDQLPMRYGFQHQCVSQLLREGLAQGFLEHGRSPFVERRSSHRHSRDQHGYVGSLLLALRVLLLPPGRLVRGLTSAQQGAASAIVTAGIIVSGLVGCSAQGDVTEDPAASSAPAFGQDAGDWNMSEHDILSVYQSNLEGLAAQYLLDEVPEVELVRFVSVSEWPQVQSDCLTEQGFSARPGPQGGIEFDTVPDDQGAAQRIAAYTCEARYPVDPRRTVKLPQKQAEDQYEHLSTTLLTCIRGLGYEVSEPPSLEMWLSQYYGEKEFWDPYVDVARIDSVALDTLYAECPHDAPNLYPDIPGLVEN